MGNADLLPVDRVLLPVHPHVHGERGDYGNYWNLRIGSSPRTWGTLVAKNGFYFLVRFIPTYMGNADVVYTTPGTYTVHPHVHGERTRQA